MLQADGVPVPPLPPASSVLPRLSFLPLSPMRSHEMSTKQRRQRPHRSLAAEVIRRAYDDARDGKDVDWDNIRPWAAHLNINLRAIRRKAEAA